MKKIVSVLLIFALLTSPFIIFAEDTPDHAAVAATGTAASIEEQITAKAALLMEASTGKILFEKDKDVSLPPASVTKIMTMLLGMEAISNGQIEFTDIVTCSTAASKMGGSQVYLKEGEKMTVNELFKAIAVASGNDASVMLAEYIAGSEGEFIDLMNKRAAQLGMENTNFVNCTGLEDAAHRTTANDVAIMSKELLRHEKILDYTSIWMDSLRDGQFTLANTNRLIRFYNGANGLKTGSTDAALYCVSASAKRNDMQLIAVILGGSTSDERFNQASKLLDYGFAKYTVANIKDETGITPVKVIKGVKLSVPVAASGEMNIVVEKGKEKLIEKKISIINEIKAPVEKNFQAGEIIVTLEGEEITRIPILTTDSVKKGSILFYIKTLLEKMY